MALRLACGTLAVLITLVIALGTAYLRAEPERRPERERLTPATRLVPELPEGAPVAATPVRV
ncbi:MAG: lytic transglycosylase domain-containing protein, partial [Thermobispora bispora]|nr:lytic transglycosylase domain-containing protein [Thermobispora bispora]